MITKKLIISAVASVVIVFLYVGCDEPGDSEPLLVVGHHQESGEAVFTVDDDGNPAPSLETELIEKMADQAGFRVRFHKVDYPEPNFAQINSEDTLSEFFKAFVEALDEGSIDVVIGNFWILSKREEVVDYLIPHLPEGVDSDTTPVAFCVREGNTELKADLDAALTALDDDGTLPALREKYNLD